MPVDAKILTREPIQSQLYAVKNSYLESGHCRPLFPIVYLDFSALLSRRSQVRLLLGGQFGEISTVWIDPIVVEIDDT